MPSRIQRELAFLLTGRDVSATKSLDKVDRAILRVNRHAGKAGRAIGHNIETGVVLGATAAAGAIGYAVNAAMDWESAFSGVRKTLNGTPEELAAIGDGIRAMAREMPISANELASIAEQAAALGVAKGDILDFTRTVGLLSVTTNLSSDAAATALGHLKTTLGLTGKDFRELGDEIVYLGNNGASTEAEIVSMAENIAGAAQVVGASKEQVLGWASALASAGEEAEAGGSSIQRFWLMSFKSVNKGGANLQLMAKIAGTSAASFKKSFGKDATGTLAKFLVSLGKLGKAEQVATLEKLGFKDIRITRALLKLLGNTDNLTGALGDADHAAGAMGKEAEQRFKTTASAMAILKNNINDAAITIGSELLPELAKLSQEGTDWIQDHQPEIKQFAHDLAEGIHDAVTWAKSLDWDAIGGALKAGAGAAALLVQAFTHAPPWLQQFLAAGFVANKFTGGVIGDVIGDVFKATVKATLGINAGVVNVNGKVVNGGGSPGVGGPGTAATGAAATAGILLSAGAAAELGYQVTEAIGEAAKGIFAGFNPTPEQTTLQNKLIDGSQSLFFPGMDTLHHLDDLPGKIGMLVDVLQGKRDPITYEPIVNAVEALKADTHSELIGVADAIKQVPQGWTGATKTTAKTTAAADRLTGLQAWLKRAQAAGQTARAEDIANRIAAVQSTGLASALAPLQGDTKSEGLATRAAIDGVTAKQADSLVAFRDGERTSATGLSNVAGVTRTGAAGTTAATNLGTSRIVAAIGASRPVVTTNVYVTPAAVTSATTTQERSGPSTGSRGSGSNGASKPT